MKNKKVIVFLFLLAVVVLGGFFYKKERAKQVTNNKQEQNEIKVGLIQNLADVNFLFDFANDKGFFEKNDLKVIPVILNSNSDNAMQAGETDVRIGDLSGTISAYLNNGQPRWIASTFKRFGSVAISRYGKNDSSKIKKVAIIQFGTSAQIINNIALKNIGVDTDKVEFVAVPSDAAREAMLENGTADFTILASEKYLSDSGKEKNYTIYNSQELFGGNSFLRAVTTTQAKIEQKPKQTQKFVHGLYQALQYLKQNKNDAVAFLQSKYGFAPDKAESFYNEFLQASEGVGFAPDGARITELTNQVIKEFKPSNPTRDMKDFVFDEYAKTEN